MNRRRFLSTIGAAVAALFVPEPAAEPIFALGPGGFLRARDYTAFMNVNEYTAIVHPDNMADIRTLMNGEIGRYEGVRFIEQWNVANPGHRGDSHTWTTECMT